MGWLLPVGTAGGMNSGFANMPDGSGLVRCGDQLACLEPDHYRLWRAAMSAPQAEELISWAISKGIFDAAERLDQLVDAELLLEEGPQLAQQVGRLALRCVGECLGNGAELGPAFFVSGRGGAQLQVDGFLFELLLRSDGVSPVAVTCVAVDAQRTELGYRPRIQTLVNALPVLVRNGVVVLEAAVK